MAIYQPPPVPPTVVSVTGRQPYAGGKIAAPLPAPPKLVDRPPGDTPVILRLLKQPSYGQVYHPRKLAPALFAASTSSVPFSRTWLNPVVGAWQFPDKWLEPQRKVTPPSVDSPPFSHSGRRPVNPAFNWFDQKFDWVYMGLANGDQPYANRQATPPSVDNPPKKRPELPAWDFWRLPDPIPQTAARFDGQPGWSVDNPPGLVQARLGAEIPTPYPQLPIHLPQGAAAAAQVPQRFGLEALRAWQPGDPFPQLRALLPPDILAVPVNNPPFSHFGRWALTNDLIRAWQPPDPLPTIIWPRYYAPNEIVVTYVPYGRAWLTGVLGAWTTPDPLPQALKSTVAIPGWSVDNPPGRRPVQAYQAPPDPMPQTGARFEGQPGWSVDNPPGFSISARFGGQFEAPLQPQQPRLGSPDALSPARTDQPTPRYSPANAAIALWQPGDPFPTQRGPLNPSFLAVAVDNPPFSSRSDLPTIWMTWQPPPPLPTPSVRVSLTTSGPIPPPTNPERFTVSGPDVSDLFGPIGDISWNWAGGTQRRTV